jgi:poly(A) polymerase
MPIITPSYPQQNSTFNVSTSTRTIMTNEFKHAHDICEQIVAGKCEWKELFEPLNFFGKYKHFLSVIGSDQAEWIGLLESKMRLLVQSLERQTSIQLVNLNPNSYQREIVQPVVIEPPTDNPEELEKLQEEKAIEAITGAPGAVGDCKSETIWFIGLEFEKKKGVNIDLTQDIHNFVNLVKNAAITNQIYKDSMQIDIKHVKRTELSKYLSDEIYKKLVKDKTPKEKATNFVHAFVFFGTQLNSQ